MKRKLVLLVLLAGPALAAERAAPSSRPPAARKARGPAGWLKRLGSAEVNFALRLSAWGIPEPREPGETARPSVTEPAPHRRDLLPQRAEADTPPLKMGEVAQARSPR